MIFKNNNNKNYQNKIKLSNNNSKVSKFRKKKMQALKTLIQFFKMALCLKNKFYWKMISLPIMTQINKRASTVEIIVLLKI